MKLFLLSFLCLIAAFSNGQRIALLSKDFKQPIIYTDSLTAEQLSEYFPVEVKDFDTLYASLKTLSNMLKERQRSKMKSFEFRAGSTTLKTSRLPKAYGDAFNIVAITKINEIQSQYNITSHKNNNANNSRRIEKILAYISQNKSLFKAPYEISPKYYNVIIVSEN